MSTLNIIGTIGVDFTAQDMLDFLQSNNDKQINVNIASGGGSVFDGFMIYDFLVQSKKKVVTNVVGLAGSAASVIFMAGDERKMTVSGMIMTHKSSITINGNADDLEEKISTLREIDERMRSIISAKTNLSDEDLDALFKGDNFMGVDEALEKGLATGIADTGEESIAACMKLVESKHKQKEPIMADLEKPEVEKDEKGLIEHIKAWFIKDEPKAEAEEPKSEDEEDEEEAKAEDKEEEQAVDEEKEQMKARIAALEKELAEAEAKAEGDVKAKQDESVDKAGLVFDAMTDDKITMHEAKDLVAKSIDEVKAALDSKEANATGRGKTEEPVEEPKANLYEEYMALSGTEQTKFFAENKEQIIEEMNKEK